MFKILSLIQRFVPDASSYRDVQESEKARTLKLTSQHLGADQAECASWFATLYFAYAKSKFSDLTDSALQRILPEHLAKVFFV